MTQALLLLARWAGDSEETFRFQYRKRVSYPLGGIPTTDSKMFPWVRLEPGQHLTKNRIFKGYGK